MAIKQCPACGQSFQPRPQVPLQTYCSAPTCQQHRKRQWHRNKLQTDPDYQENQQRAQQSWIERNPDYWRQYRESHPKYVDRNRTLQRTRNAKAKTNPIRINSSKAAAIWNLQTKFGDRNQYCKDGRLDCRNYGTCL